ncbi:MAG TPA: cytochrome c1, partial [Rhizomicrobium sp.]|nr:cytochrome c1 [Rhizomicrobium sp.]
MRLTTVTLGTALALLASTSAFAVDTTRLPPKDEKFSFEGPFGTYDRGALQRGYQVYKEVCAACHAVNHLAFHNLAEAGGPEFTEAQARALAAAAKVPAE